MYQKKYSFVYIITNKHNTVLYTGVTNNLLRRIAEHKNGKGSVFTKKYNIHKLVYYQVFENIKDAINREKQIKAGPRRKKIELIESQNPDWEDLYSQLM